MDSRSLLRHGLHSIGPRRPPTRTNSAQALVESPPARKAENGMDALWRKGSGRTLEIALMRVDCRVRPQAPHQLLSIGPAGGCQHPRAAPLCELNRHGSDAARRAVNDHSLVSVQFE